MHREAVSSSNIRSIGYDAQAMILEVEFHDGSVYQYYRVPQSVYKGLMSAESKGSYLHAHVKSYYSYKRVV